MDASDTSNTLIRKAVWRTDIAAVQALLRNYAAALRAGLNGHNPILLTGHDEELQTLPQRWSEPDGVLLLAVAGTECVGCVAVAKHPEPRRAACEMKRLWVEPRARGAGLGRQLALAALQWSRDAGAHVLLLDTVPAAMPEAAAMYASLGFVPAERFHAGDLPGLHFFSAHLIRT